MITKRERALEFRFRTALNVDQPEVKAQPFKCADFFADEEDATWMIEVSDSLSAEPEQLQQSIGDLLSQLKSGRLAKDSLMKLYGSHAYLAQINQNPGRIVFFCLIYGLPPGRGPKEENAQRNRIRDEMARITNRIGPSFHGSENRPIIKVDSIESWGNDPQHANVEVVRI
jgi:hypothetical protein